MNLFAKKRTLAEVIGSFHKTVKELDVLISENEQQVLANADVIVDLQKVNADLTAEVAKAAKVRKNITQLIED